MNEPLISVIVPVYKVEKYLRKCVDSIINQTYTNLEIILVDDGSPDGCPAICDEYALKDSRVRVIHQQNGGVSSARNAGLASVRGEYISFVDSDDFIELNSFEKMISAFGQSVDIVISMAKWIHFSTGNIEYHECIALTTVDIDSNYNFGSFHANHSVWGKLYRRSVIESLRFDESIFLGEDSLFFAQAVLNSRRIRYIPDFLYNYYQYDNSLSHGAVRENQITVITAWKKIFDLFSDYQKSAEYCASVFFSGCFFIYQQCVLSLSPDRELSRRVRKMILSPESNDVLKKALITPKKKLKYLMLKYTRHLFDAVLITKSR